MGKRCEYCGADDLEPVILFHTCRNDRNLHPVTECRTCGTRNFGRNEPETAELRTPLLSNGGEDQAKYVWDANGQQQKEE